MYIRTCCLVYASDIFIRTCRGLYCEIQTKKGGNTVIIPVLFNKGGIFLYINRPGKYYVGGFI